MNIILIINTIQNKTVTCSRINYDTSSTFYICRRINDRAPCLQLILNQSHPFLRRNIVITFCKHIPTISIFTRYEHTLIVVILIESYKRNGSLCLTISIFCFTCYTTFKYQLTDSIFLHLRSIRIILIEHILPIISSCRIINIILCF